MNSKFYKGEICNCYFKILDLLLTCMDKFPPNVRLIEYDPVCGSLKEVARHAGNKVLMEVDDNSLVIISNLQRILDEQLMPHPVHVLNIGYYSTYLY